MVNVKHKKCLPVTPHQTCHTAALNQTEYVTVRQVIMCKYEESKWRRHREQIIPSEDELSNHKLLNFTCFAYLYIDI